MYICVLQHCAASVTRVYRECDWRSLQTAAAATTQLYKSGLDCHKRGYDKGFQVKYLIYLFNLCFTLFLMPVVSVTKHGCQDEFVIDESNRREREKGNVG